MQSYFWVCAGATLVANVGGSQLKSLPQTISNLRASALN